MGRRSPTHGATAWCSGRVRLVRTRQADNTAPPLSVERRRLLVGGEVTLPQDRDGTASLAVGKTYAFAGTATASETKLAISRIENGLRRNGTALNPSGTSLGVEPETNAKGVPF